MLMVRSMEPAFVCRVVVVDWLMIWLLFSRVRGEGVDSTARPFSFHNYILPSLVTVVNSLRRFYGKNFRRPHPAIQQGHEFSDGSGNGAIPCFIAGDGGFR